MGQRIAIALSGGADSALAATIVQEEGYDAFGLHGRFTDSAAAIEQAQSARRVAEHLGMSIETVDLSSEFNQAVIRTFCAEYASGRTPNPCVVCNASIKFGSLLRAAQERGADLLATGHYARAVTDEDGTRLLRAVDHGADQSYFLYRVNAASLSRSLLPLGYLRRSVVKSRVRSLGLPTGPKSRDLCFVNDRRYHRVVAQWTSPTPGPILDGAGRVCGCHKGLAYYTVGQRHGLELALGHPVYVTKLLPQENTLVVGPESELYAQSASVSELAWISGHAPASHFTAEVRIRYRARASLAEIRVAGNTASVVFNEPQRAVAPGQSIVVYNGETVLGGGFLQAAW